MAFAPKNFDTRPKMAPRNLASECVFLFAMVLLNYLYPTCIFAADNVPSTRPQIPFQFPVGQESITIPLARDHIQLFAKASIKGEEIGYMLIDTGSEITTIGPDIASRFKLQPIGGRNATNQVGTERLNVFSVDRLELGSLNIEDIPVFASAGYTFKKISGATICGVLGLDAIGRTPFTLDLREATLTLHDPKAFRPPTAVPAFDIRPGTPRPVVRAAVEGNDGWFEIDTGRRNSLLLSAAFVQLYPELFKGRPMMSEAVPWQSNQDIFTTRLSSFDFLGERISLLFGDYQFGASGLTNVAGLIGAQMLMDARLTVDLPNSRVWLERRPLQQPEDFVKLFGDPKSRDLGGATPLIHAVFRKNAPAVSRLITAGTDPDDGDDGRIRPLMVAAARGDIESTSALIKAHAKLDAQSGFDSYTPLILAAEYGRLETAKLLLDAGVDVNMASDSGRTPLFMAADSDFAEVLEFLLARGANANRAHADGATPLMAASRNGSVRCVSILLDHGADANASSNSGAPLVYAAQSGSVDCVRLLLKSGAKINMAGKDGRTPLMAAAGAYRSGECVRTLLEAGADPDLKDAKGYTAFDYSRGGGSIDSLRLLMPKGTGPE